MYSLRAFVLCCSVLGVISTSVTTDEVLWGNSGNTTVKEFEVNWTDTQIADLRSRLSNGRAYLESLTNDFSYGFNAAILDNMTDYWADEYNFTARMEYINKYPQYIVTVQGLNLHVVRVQPEVTTNCTVTPLLITHSYPSMCYEFFDLISELTSQCVNGIVFEVIVLGMPGHAYSDAPTKAGCGASEIAQMAKSVMTIFGHDTFYIHTNDCLHLGPMIATKYPEAVRGLHTSIPMVLTPRAIFMWVVESLFKSPATFAEDITRLMNGVLSYIHLMITIPDAMSVAWSDSPRGLLTQMTAIASTLNRPLNAHLYDGGIYGQFKPELILDIVSSYWFTNSIAGASRTFSESFNWRNYLEGLYAQPTEVPTLVLDPEYFYLHQSKQQLETKYTNLLGVEYVPDVGHYPAEEKPKVVSESLFNFVLKVVEWKAMNNVTSC